uniref:Uncharacterized protein n=1 Tax=Magallana gigas TaxID=29159 RepID=A0A8W8NXT8_MAGGI
MSELRTLDGPTLMPSSGTPLNLAQMMATIDCGRTGEAFLASKCSHFWVRRLQTLTVFIETTAWLVEQRIDILLILVAERIRGYNAIAWLAN